MDSKEISTDNAETSVNNKATFEDMVKKVLKDIPSTPENDKESKQNEEISKSNKILSQKLSTEPTVSRNFPLMNSILGSPPVMPANHNREMFDPQPHPLKCQICHKICSNSYTFERHKNVHKKNFIPNVSPDVKIRELHDELPEPWRSIFKDAYEKSMTESRARDCKICGKLCAQDWIYIRHVKMHVRLLATEEESGSPQIVCELCGRQCRSFVGLKRHWDQAKHGPYPPSFKDMERAHYQEKSNQDKNKGRRHKPLKEKVPYNGIRCPICGRACRTYEILRRHWVDYQHGNIDKLEKYIIQQAAEAALKEQLDEGRVEQEQASLKEFAEKFNETTEENGSKRPSRGCKYKASYFDENNIENTDDSEAEVPENQNAREAEFREYHTEAPNSNFVYLSNPELEQDIKEEQDIDDEYAEYNKAYESFYEDPDTETSYSQGEENYEVRKDENQQAKPEGQQANAVDLFKTMGETIEKDNSDNPLDFLKNISGLLQNQNGKSEKSSGTLKIKQEKLDDDEQAYVNTGTPQQSNGFRYNSVSLNQFNNDSKNNPSNSEFEAMKNMYETPRVAESCVDNWNADGDNSINDEEADTQDDTTEDDIDQDTDGVEDNADPKDGDFVPSAESEESDIEN
ncbi:unnamed protein product [Owenia fusiformis]|uniref:C2H2-type domain-containing protein n=1 Tax=Owenia fusiformis TaxID=6347 RepID=A0A8S4P5J7_OWEFU|nr:unnamed protein product [Owenia fusiformis]